MRLQSNIQLSNIFNRAAPEPVVEDAAFWSTVVNWNTVNYGGSKTSAPAAAATTQAAAPVVVADKAATTPASSKVASVVSSATSAAKSAASSAVSDVTSSGSSDSGLLNGIVGAANSRTSFGSATASKDCPGISCINNVGNPYGSDIIKVGSTSGQTYTNTFVNTQSKSITVNIWNKAGPDGQANSGQALAPKQTTLTFVLAPGASQVVSFMENTSGGWVEATSKVASYGAFATTWGEFTFISGKSAWDVSAIQNAAGNNYNMTISGAGCTSNMDINMWVTDSQNKDASGKNVYPSDANCNAGGTSVHLTTTLGGTV